MLAGADTGFRKGAGKQLSTKTRHIRAHACNIFSLFMKSLGVPQKGGGS